MIIQIPGGLAQKALPKTGRIVSAIKGRPNPRRIDLTKVRFLTDLPNMCWTELVQFMREQLKKGFLTLGTREFMAIFCDDSANLWLDKEPRNNPWKFGNGGLIGFPNGLVQVGEALPSYDVAIWIPAGENIGWHVRQFSAEAPQTKPGWFDYLRMPVYPVTG